MIESSYQPINGESSPENQSFRGRISKRLGNIDRTYIISKLFYFFFYTALGALFPFFSLYYKQLWLSPSQTGILLALRPTVKLICLPLWKMVTDHYSKPKAVYFISIFGWLIGYYGQTLVAPDSSIPCYKTINNSSINKMNYNSVNGSLIRVASSDWGQLDSSHSLNKLKYNPFEHKIIKRNLYFERLKELKNTKKSLNRKYKQQKRDLQLEREETKVFNERIHKRNAKQQQNSKYFSTENDDQIIKKETQKSKWLPFMIEARKSPKPQDDFRVRYNYWIIRTLVVIIILTEIITTPTPMLADSAVIHSLSDTDKDYGKQRLFGCLGLALSAALVAVWVSYTTNCPYTDTLNYIPCFHIFLAAIGATVLVSLFFKFDTPSRLVNEEEYPLLEVIKIFKTPRYGFFLFSMFILGFAHSVQISFLFWFLQDIGGTPALFAFMILMHCISEVIMYFILGYIINALGSQRTLAISIGCYCVRFLMYGSLKHPWLVVPMELVQGMTYGGVWTVAGMYVKGHDDAIKQIQSVLHGAYWGVGMAMGALVSGFIVQTEGAQNLFLVVSLVMAILCITHFFIFIIDEIASLEDAENRRRAKSTSQTSKKDENFIGAAAAPLVPCLLYGQ